MSRNFVPRPAQIKKAKKIRNKISHKSFKDPTSKVSCVFFGSKPKLSDKKERYTVTLTRMVDPNELHKRLNEVIPGAEVSVLGPSSFPTDFVFITLPRTMPIREFLAVANEVMENLQ